MSGRIVTILLGAILLTSCATPRLDVPPARIAGHDGSAGNMSDEAPAADAGSEDSRPGMVRLDGPQRSASAPAWTDPAARLPAGNALTVAVEAMPMRDFVNYAFGELLQVSYVVADGIAGLEQPVTLNLQQPVSSRALYRLIAEMLNGRGVGITFKDGVYFIAPADGKGRGDVPIGFGRNPSDVPDAAGRVLQVIPLLYGTNAVIERTARDLVDIQVFPDAQQSALFVTGERQAILKVLDIVRLLDQPTVRAGRVGLINLTYVGSKEFTDQLVTLLENEGIPAGVGRADGKNVALVPLEQLGALVIFASSAELLDRVEFWTRQIDRPSQGPAQRYFIYHPKFARASDLGESLAPLIAGPEGARLGNLARDTRSALGPQPAESATAANRADITRDTALRRETPGRAPTEQPVSIQGEGLTLSVDPRSNSLIFYTSGPRYESLLPMIRRLDVPPKQILLEATVAEVLLTGEFAYGVEFAATEGRFSGGTEGGLGLPSGGFALDYISSVTDSVRLKLTASNSLVNVLSNPVLMVRDGVRATISIGQDVPTVGATASDPIQSDRQITTVLYRRTGLNLDIRPTINAQGLVVMEINQNISNTVPGASGVAGAPTFFDRSVTTEVVARSGQTILLAGLISSSQTDTSTRVPWISRVPGLGWLFRSDSKTKEKTELVLLITPRIIDTPDDWDLVRGGLERALEHLRLPPDGGAIRSPGGPAVRTDGKP